MANVGSVAVFVLYEAVSFFIYSVIRQVHAQIVQVAPSRTLVRIRRESRQSFFVNETS